MNNLPELTDVQMMLIIKKSLEYNAEIIKLASFVYGQNLKEHTRNSVIKEFKNISDDYTNYLEKVVAGKI